MKDMPPEVQQWRASLSRSERRRMLEEKAKYMFKNWRGQPMIWCGPDWKFNLVTQTFHRIGWLTKITRWWNGRRG